ncbi:hypothetical protein D3C83_32200 [compost metagenome]
MSIEERLRLIAPPKVQEIKPVAVCSGIVRLQLHCLAQIRFGLAGQPQLLQRQGTA